MVEGIVCKYLISSPRLVKECSLGDVEFKDCTGVQILAGYILITWSVSRVRYILLNGLREFVSFKIAMFVTINYVCIRCFKESNGRSLCILPHP